MALRCPGGAIHQSVQRRVHNNIAAVGAVMTSMRLLPAYVTQELAKTTVAKHYLCQLEDSAKRYSDVRPENSQYQHQVWKSGLCTVRRLGDGTGGVGLPTSSAGIPTKKPAVFPLSPNGRASRELPKDSSIAGPPPEMW